MCKTSLLLLCGLTLMCGCNLRREQPPGSYRTVARDPRRDTALARSETSRAKALMAANELEKAEKVLKAALAADLFYAPAHNNLGVVYYRQKKFYLAAWEFQYAARLMPNKPQPKNNLGMVLEAVGRLKEAEQHYDKALAIEPDNAVFIGNLARCRIRLGRRTPQTRDLLQQIILKDTRPEWVQWARRELMDMPASKVPATQPTAPAPTPPPP